MGPKPYVIHPETGKVLPRNFTQKDVEAWFRFQQRGARLAGVSSMDSSPGEMSANFPYEYNSGMAQQIEIIKK